MKYLIIFLSFIFFSGTLTAQEKTSNTVTEKVMVSGSCSMCKKRIEKAAYGKGVKLAEWDKDAKELTIVYRTDKTDKEAILKRVADAGHDSEKFTASKEDYSKLPECCNYRTGTCEH